MQKLQLRKASRQKAKLRINVSSPSGGGKTTGALLMAAGITGGDWSKVGFIDTEEGSSELYVGRTFGSTTIGEFAVIPLSAPYSPERYIQAIKMIEDAELEVIIIDSASHEWIGTGGCLQINDQLAQASNSRNASFSSWNETKRRHRMFIDKILNSPCHVICTSRSKTDHFIGDDGKVRKLGLKEQQEGDFEYEFTLTFNSRDREKNLFVIGKNRTDIDYGQDGFVITEKFGVDLVEWATSGKEPIPEIKFKKAPAEELEEIKDIIAELDLSNDDRKALFARHDFIGKPSEMDSDTSHNIVMELHQMRVDSKMKSLDLDEGSEVKTPDLTMEGLMSRAKICGCDDGLKSYCKSKFASPKDVTQQDMEVMNEYLNLCCSIKNTDANLNDWLSVQGVSSVFDLDLETVRKAVIEMAVDVNEVQKSKG